MTKDRKRRKPNSSTEEESFEGAGKSRNADREKEFEKETEEEEQTDSESEVEDVEETRRKVEHAISELEGIRNRCNGRISGQIKSVLADIRKGTKNLVKIAIKGETEREQMKLEIESLRAKTETMNREFVEGTENIRRELAGIRNLREDMRSAMRKEMEEMMRKMVGGPGARWNGEERIGASSTPILQRGTGRIEEEDRIEVLEEGKIERRGEESRIGVSYAEAAGKKVKKIFGRRAGFQLETKAVVEQRQDVADREYPVLETPRPQRFRKEENRECNRPGDGHI